jgi:hypothetical protein
MELTMNKVISRAGAPGRRWLSLLLGTAFVAYASHPAAAQSGQTVRVRGTIERFDGKTLVVASRDGGDLAIAVAPDHTVAAVKAKDLADVKAGDYIGTATAPAGGGGTQALEVTVFPESARGAGEGSRPWDLVPGSGMTNATISGMSGDVDSPTLSLTYKGGEAQVHVPAGTPVVTFAPGDDTLLQAGKAVFVFAQKRPDGSLATNRITVEKDGVKPPM